MSSSTRYEARGLCISCGQVPPEPARKRCRPCRDLNTQSRYRISEVRQAKGMCRACGVEPHRPARQVCVGCTDKQRKVSMARRGNRKAVGRCTECDAPSLPGSIRCGRCDLRIYERRQRQRVSVMEAYGGVVCACCGETRLEFLTIDHIHNDGASHRKEVGSMLYNWLKSRGFPPGFQVLCYNCNCAKGHLGYCPHKHEIDNPDDYQPDRR